MSLLAGEQNMFNKVQQYLDHVLHNLLPCTHDNVLYTSHSYLPLCTSLLVCMKLCICVQICNVNCHVVLASVQVFTARCTIVHSAVLRLHVICLYLSASSSVTLVDHDHIGWKSWKLIARTISPTSSLFVAERSSTYSQVNMEKFWGKIQAWP